MGVIVRCHRRHSTGSYKQGLLSLIQRQMRGTRSDGLFVQGVTHLFIALPAYALF